jgi:hypothetical protein
MAITRIGPNNSTNISGITNAQLAGSINNSKFANIVQSKNIIINGDMQISQRSTSQASITSDGYYTLDRFTTEIGSFGTWTQSQSTDVPTGQGFANSLKMDCTTAQGSPGSSAVMLVGQSIEGQMLQYLCWGTSDAKQVTLSFWHKHTKTGTNIVELLESDNNDAVSGSYTQSVSDTWEKATITFPAKTSGAIDNDNARSLRIRFIIGSGTDNTSGTLATTWQSSITNANRYAGQVNNADSTSNNFIITGVQLEAGDTASEFEFLPYDVNLRRCHRYCLILGDAPGGATYDYADDGVIGHYYNSTDFYPNFFFPVPMRSTPGVSFSTTGSGLGDVSSQNTAKTGTSAGTNATSATNINFRISTASATQGSGGAFNFAANDYVILSAEL